MEILRNFSYNPNHSVVEAYFQKKTILITGAAGFIGGHLIRRLHTYGARIIALDKIMGEQIFGVHWIVTDLLDLTLEQLEDFGIQIVYHLAAVLGVSYAWKNPNQTMAVNVLGTDHILKLARLLEVKALCVISSSEVYGEPETLPITEENKLQPLSIYGWSKVCVEKMLEACVGNENLYGVVIRPFNVYGPRQRSEFVVSRFMSLAIENQQIEIVGSGRQKRVFTFIDDFIDGVLLAIMKNTRGFHVYNLAGQEPISILDLAKLIISITNANVELVYRSEAELQRNPDTEIFMRIPSIEKAKRELQYEPRVSIKAGLEVTYADICANL